MACSAESRWGRAGSIDPLPVEADMKGVIGDSRIVAGGILASRITGFGRIVVAAAVLGPTFFGNLFQTVAVVPGILYSLLMGTLIAAVLVPPMVRHINNGDPAGVSRFACGALGLMLSGLVVIGGLGMVLSPAVLRAMTATVSDPVIRQQQVRLGIPLLLMVMPQIALYGIVGAGIAVQQAHKRFAIASSAPAIENLITIAVLGASGWIYGSGSEIGQISRGHLLLLGVGVTFAVAVHAFVQWIGAWRAGVVLLPRLYWNDKELRALLRRMASTIGYTSLYWLAYLMILAFVGTVPGGVAGFQLANAFCIFPVALTAVPLAAAQLPRLAASQDRGDSAAFRHVYLHGLRLTMFTAVPAGVLLVVLPHTLAGAAAFGAMSAPAGISLIAACLGSLGLGVIGEAAFTLTTPAYYVRHDAASPLYAMLIRLAIVVVGGGIALALLPPGNALLAGLGGALATANLAAGGYLCRRLLRALPARGPADSGLASSLVLALAACLPARLLAAWLQPAHALGPGFDRTAQAVAVLGSAALLYLVFQFARGSEEIRLLLPVRTRPASQHRPAGS